jgi:hypothetical protein
MKELTFEHMEEVQGGSWGQDTMNCVTDAYTNYGWSSVVAWVATAAFWPISLGFVATCAVATYK